MMFLNCVFSMIAFTLTRLAKTAQKKAAAKESLRKHREKIYSNPELLEEYRRKERER